ncbi:MAG: serine--tRNA ligase [Bacteroidia bacterium]|nr:serine--tRNA ligase [Bacteroidia bacterium]
MIELQQLRENRDTLIERLQIRGYASAAEELDKVLSLDAERRRVITRLEGMRAEMNTVSKSIGRLIQEGKKEQAAAAQKKTGQMKEDIKFYEESLEKIEKEMDLILINVPNPPHPSVPKGKSAEDNEIVYRNDIEVTLPANAKPHWDLIKDLDIVSLDLGVKISGAGFPVYIGKGARLQRALIQYFLDEAEKAGYVEIQPPLMVNEASGYGTGQLPDKEGQMYHVQIDDLYLIPTAEVPITNLYRDTILKDSQLPVKNCGYTPCFRREAGSYGKHVRGLNRLHQFDKVEIVQVVEPEISYQVLDTMVEHVKGLLQNLGLPFRIALLCGGDMGFTSAKTFDMEVYSAAQEQWLEVSSISNFETFQSNRLKLRYKDADRQTRLPHTLNGSALALPRIFASILENNQNEDGSVTIPEVLRPYTRFDFIGRD